MALKLDKITLPNAHIIHGREFPAAYKLSGSDDGTTDEVIELLRAEAAQGWFNEQLERHGAIVLRGLGSSDPKFLSEVIKAIGYGSGDVLFEQTGSTAQRTQISDVLTTANETDPSVYINQHNEFSRFTKYPTKLFFVCDRYNAEGGETPIVHGREYFESLYEAFPEQVIKLGKRGLLMNQTWPRITTNNTSWQDYYVFGREIDASNDDLATQKKKAGKLVDEYVSTDYRWADNNDLVVNEHTDPFRNYESQNGESFPISFNSLATFYYYTKNQANKGRTNAIVYDDGEPIPTDFLDHVLKASQDLSYHHHWEQGDVALVSNYLVSHGRDPWKNGDRSILVSMWDTPNKADFKAWKGFTVAAK